MDEDFSVRNEVDSVRPPYAEDFTYEHQESPYTDIIDSINSAPPFPSAPISPSAPLDFSLLVKQQARMLQQQQILNSKLLSLIMRNQSINWKHIALVLGLILLLYLWPRFTLRQNPRISRFLSDAALDD